MKGCSMNKEEAVKEAANHLGLYFKKAKEAADRGFIKHQDIDDVVQEMYLAGVTSFLTYDPAKGRPGTYLGLPMLYAVQKFRDRERRHFAYRLDSGVKRWGDKKHSMEEFLARPHQWPIDRDLLDLFDAETVAMMNMSGPEIGNSLGLTKNGGLLRRYRAVDDIKQKLGLLPPRVSRKKNQNPPRRVFKLSWQKAREIRQLHAAWVARGRLKCDTYSPVNIGRRYGVGAKTIFDVVRGRIYKEPAIAFSDNGAANHGHRPAVRPAGAQAEGAAGSLSAATAGHQDVPGGQPGDVRERIQAPVRAA